MVFNPMSDSASFFMSVDDDDGHESEKETTPGGQQPVKWEVVARMPGITAATIVAGRLEAEEIPVRVWQEGAGQAIGLTVGLLGIGYVAVPEEYAEEAKEIIGEDAVSDEEDEWYEEWDEEWDEEE
jgi:hypothetical protein